MTTDTDDTELHQEATTYFIFLILHIEILQISKVDLISMNISTATLSTSERLYRYTRFYKRGKVKLSVQEILHGLRLPWVGVASHFTITKNIGTSRIIPSYPLQGDKGGVDR